MQKKTRVMLVLSCVLAGGGCLAAPLAAPDVAARGAIALCDEVDVETVDVPAMTTDGSPAQEPQHKKWALRGEKLRRFRALVDVTDGHGAMCMCDGDYQFRFKRWGVPLASFRAHVRETPARLFGSFGILSLDSEKAHHLAGLLARLAR